MSCRYLFRSAVTTFVGLMTMGFSTNLLGQATVEQTELTATTPESRGDDWWVTRHKEKLADKNQRLDEIKLVMIGDSITHSWETTGKEIWDKYYAPRGALNLGYSGDRTEHVLWRLQHGEVEGISPRAVVVMIGTNNAGHRDEPSVETAAGVRAILDELRERLPAARILLLAIFPRDAKPDGAYRKLTDGTNALIQSYTDGKHIVYLDIADKLLDDHGQLPASIMPDELHPNAAGYKIWAAAMQPTLEELMSANDSQ